MSLESVRRSAGTAALSAETVVRARGLRKTYGDLEALAGIDFDVTAGQIVGFLGPNGAGKSSAMRMISATSPISGGVLRVLGMDPATDASAVRSMLGVCPQDDNLDTDLTVLHNLVIYGRFFGIPRRECRARANELLQAAGLLERVHSNIEDLSGGMRRRLTIARSLMNRPSLLLLDEPTTGLDPQARHILWEQLESLRRQGVTQLLTTHYMDEAERLCDRVIIIDKGVIIAQGSPRGLITEYLSMEIVELRFEAAFLPDERPRIIQSLVDAGEDFEVLPNSVLLYSGDGESAVEGLRLRGIRPTTALVRRSNLEDVFIRLTGRNLGD